MEPAPSEGSGWEQCTCGSLVYRKRLRRQDDVCPECGRHRPLSAPRRLAGLLDPGWELLDIGRSDVVADPLTFRDTVSYSDRLTRARLGTGLDEAVVCATGAVEGHPVVVAAMDFRFLGGSLGCAVGEAVTRAAEAALRLRHPLVLVTASGGARMQEGVLSLMQMAKTSQAMRDLDEAGVLTVSVITDPTFGGVAASYATLADVIVAEPGARLGFAGPRVIAQTLRRSLPDGFQTAEYLAECGMVDVLCPRPELRATLGRLLATTRGLPAVAPGAPPGPAGPPADPTVVITDPDLVDDGGSWQAVLHARRIDRPGVTDYTDRLVSGFQELRGDRRERDCPAVLGGLGLLDGTPVLVLGTRKGHTAEELRAHNFGMASPAGYRKAARLMRLAAKLGLPVVTLIDTPGAYPGVEAERSGQAYAVAENLRLMAGLPVPTVAVLTGEGGSGGALALALADRVLMLSGAVYSVISAEGCAAILWHDAAEAPAAAAALRPDARHTLALGVVDGVIPEPAGGAAYDHDGAADRVRAALVATLDELRALPDGDRRTERHARYRRFGALPGRRSDRPGRREDT